MLFWSLSDDVTPVSWPPPPSLPPLSPLRPIRRCLKETSTWRAPVRGGLCSWPCCQSPSGQVSTWAWPWRSSLTCPRTTTGKTGHQGGKITHQALGACLGCSPGVSGERFLGRSPAAMSRRTSDGETRRDVCVCTPWHHTCVQPRQVDCVSGDCWDL